MFEKTIGPRELANLAGLSEVMLFKNRKKEVGPPWSQDDKGRIHYPLAPAMAWVIDRHLEKRAAA